MDLLQHRQSSTWRGICHFVLFTFFLPLLEGFYEKLFSDSQSACKIIQVGSMRSDLHAVAAEIFQFYATNGIELELQWIPRTEIEKADYISRVIGIDDWQILADCSMSLEESWGVHSLDCFANYYSTKVYKIFSKIWNPGTTL